MPRAEWDACEDCMGTGRVSVMFGGGECGSCAGTGKFPANEHAREMARAAQRAHEEAAYEHARRMYDDYEYEPDFDDYDAR